MKMHETLNDALPAGDTEIWYQTRETWEGSPRIAKKSLEKTHVKLGSIAMTDKESIFREMQGEFWSPEGEARDLIRKKGLVHTSMSVNDVVKIGSRAWRVAGFGFEEI